MEILREINCEGYQPQTYLVGGTKLYGVQNGNGVVKMFDKPLSGFSKSRRKFKSLRSCEVPEFHNYLNRGN
jgi:hypothetical protein